MIKYLKTFLLVCLVGSCAKKDENLKIAFTGDVILDRGVNDELKLFGDSLLLDAFNLLKQYDYSVINLEGTFSDSGIIQTDKYNFKTHKQKAAILSQAGVTHVSVANNHIYDFGNLGYHNTIDAIQSNNLIPLGNTPKAEIIKKGNYQCAVLSVSLTTHNELLPISSISKLKSSVQNFINDNEEIPLVVYIHWGLELQPTPENWQKELAKDLTKMGVDAIIGHHPHITQTIEFINDKPVFYSVGNYIADAYLPNTDLSYVVDLEVKNTIESVKIIPVRLQNYFPKHLQLKEQIDDLRKHIKYSEICLVKRNKKWSVEKFSNIDFSDTADLWMIAEKNTISLIKKLNSQSYLLYFQKDGIATNVINLHGEISDYKISDINNDGNIDVLIGISKKVKFDPIKRKRINIYTFQNEALKPLWLGTKFIHDVKSFTTINHNNLNYLSTVEMLNGKDTIERIYKWDDFGFALTELNNFKK